MTGAALVIFGVVIIVCLYGLVRNRQVYVTRRDMLTRISEAARADIDAGREWQWRYAEWEAVPYERHLLALGPIRWDHDPARAEP